MIDVASVFITVSALESLVVFLPCHCQGLTVLFLPLRLLSLHSSYLNQTVLIGDGALET